MAMSPEQLAAIDRLKNKYNGSAYNALTNPGGLASGGHRVNFEPALQDTATAGEATAEQAEAAAGFADAARRIALFFEFDNGTSDADPGDGKFCFNHATLSSATMLYIDVETVAETDVTDWIATWDDSNSAVRGELTFISATDAAVWAKFQITGSNTDASGYRKVALTYVDHAGTFTDGDEFAVGFSRTGSKGEPGNDGDDGDTGPAPTLTVNSVTTGSPGSSVTFVLTPTSATEYDVDVSIPAGDKGDASSLTFQFSTTTSDGDPGSGTFRLNNATVASATQMFIDDAPQEGGSAAAWIATWDDSTNSANRGTVTLIDLADRSNWAVFDVTGANTGASGYTKVALTYVTGNGTFANAAVFSIEFKRTGNKGADGMGSGDVVGPASAVDSRFAAFDTTTGKLLKDSGKSASDFATAAQGGLADTAVQPGDSADDLAEGSTNKFMTGSERSKLSGIESSADVTDATNVAAAGAFMKSSDDLDDITEGSTNKHFTSTEKTKLSGVEASADVTDAGNVGAAINGASGKTTPVDADVLGLIDSAASNILKTLTWANLKTGIWSALGALINGGTAKTTPVDADLIAIADSAASNASKKVTLTNLWANYLFAKVFGTENVALTGGATVTSKSLGTTSSGTRTLDVGDCPLQHYTNGGAHTLAPGSITGSALIDITNNGSAGAITTSGFAKVSGDSFTTTNGHKFRCHVSVGNGGSLLIVQALQ